MQNTNENQKSDFQRKNKVRLNSINQSKIFLWNTHTKCGKYTINIERNLTMAPF